MLADFQICIGVPLTVGMEQAQEGIDLETNGAMRCQTNHSIPTTEMRNSPQHSHLVHFAICTKYGEMYCVCSNPSLVDWKWVQRNFFDILACNRKVINRNFTTDFCQCLSSHFEIFFSLILHLWFSESLSDTRMS